MSVGIVVVALGMIVGWASVALGICTGSQGANGARLKRHEVAWLWVVPAVLSAQIVWASYLSTQPGAALSFRWLIPISTTVLLAIVIRNANWMGARLVACGVAMNLLVILANGGLMPINFSDARASVPRLGVLIAEGRPLPGTKDIVLAPADTRLRLLADHFVVRLPYGPMRVFSPGDLVMLLGLALWFGHGVRETLLERGSAWQDTPERVDSSSCLVTAA